MSSTPYLKLKKNLLVYYSLPDQKRYNEKSKENLVQNQNSSKCVHDLKKLKKYSDEILHDNIKDHANNYLQLYKDVMKKPFKTTFSRMQQKKIADSTNTFIDVVANNYKKSKGLNQRMITFITLTIPGEQKHTDKVLIKTLIDFIDHLKKVKNTLIENKEDTGKELLKLENYVWRAETTEAGNIHFHLLFDTYVNHITLKRVWNNYLKKLGYEGGENSANIHNLKNINDVGGYITKYLTKEPLNNEFNDLLKTKKISRDDLKNYDDSVKYRRPILYSSWGCSRRLKTLKAPTFSGAEILDFNEIKNQCSPVELPEELRDFIKIYKGKIYDILKTCSKSLKQKVKQKFNTIYHFLYEKTDQQLIEFEKLVWLHRQIITPDQIAHPEPVAKKINPFIPNLF